MSFFDILMRGGWMMLPIYLCFLLMCVVGCERWIVQRRVGWEGKVDDLDRFLDRLRRDDREGAARAARELPPTLAALAALAVAGASPARLAVEISERTDELDANMAVLGTLAAVAPLLGFLGTAAGMIRAFMAIEDLAGAVTPAVLAGGIWEALVTTGAGLAAGIFGLLVHNILAARVDRMATRLEDAAKLMADARTRP